LSERESLSSLNDEQLMSPESLSRTEPSSFVPVTTTEEPPNLNKSGAPSS